LQEYVTSDWLVFEDIPVMPKWTVCGVGLFCKSAASRMTTVGASGCAVAGVGPIGACGAAGALGAAGADATGAGVEAGGLLPPLLPQDQVKAIAKDKGTNKQRVEIPNGDAMFTLLKLSVFKTQTIWQDPINIFINKNQLFYTFY
jgi:hypothetical protein